MTDRIAPATAKCLPMNVSSAAGKPGLRNFNLYAYPSVKLVSTPYSLKSYKNYMCCCAIVVFYFISIFFLLIVVVRDDS